MKEYFSDLFSYEQWANSIVADAILKSDTQDEKIVLLMSHIVNAQMIWLSRIQSVNCKELVWEIHSKSELKNLMEGSSSALQNFLENTNDHDFEKIIGYSNTKGEKFESSLKDILTHLIIHSSYHRGQIVQLLKPFVQSLPYTDYIQFKRSK